MNTAYADLSPVEILRRMGGVQRNLLLGLDCRWDGTHPSTRVALIDRGLAERVTRDGHDLLVITDRGRAVRNAIYGGHQ